MCYPVLTNAVILGLMLSAGVARRQSYEVLYYSNPIPTRGDDARRSGGLIQASDGNFSGTTTEGRASGRGTVFKLDGVTRNTGS